MSLEKLGLILCQVNIILLVITAPGMLPVPRHLLSVLYLFAHLLCTTASEVRTNIITIVLEPWFQLGEYKNC